MFGYVILKKLFLEKYVKNKTYFVEEKKKMFLRFLFQKICFKKLAFKIKMRSKKEIIPNG